MNNWFTQVLKTIIAAPCVLLDGILRLAGALGSIPRTEEPISGFSPEEQAEIRRNLARLRKDLDVLADDRFLDDLITLLRTVFDDPEATNRYVKAWLNLLEEIIQDVEFHHGPGLGLGPGKKQHAKAAVLYLLQRSNFSLPNIPAFIQPVLFDFVLDPVINALVRLLNRHALWRSDLGRPSWRKNVGTRLGRGPARALDFTRKWLTQLVWRVVFVFNPVTPQVKRAVDELVGADPDVVRKPLLLLRWVGDHLSDLFVLLDLVTAASIEAQRVLRSNGAQKKAYAREVILIFLQDTIGIPAPGSVAFVFLNASIDLAIDAIVFLLKKREHPLFRTGVIKSG